MSEMQIVEHLSLFYLKIPATWSILAEYVLELTSFENIIDVDSLLQMLFYMPEIEPTTVNFQTAGYTTTLFLANANSTLFCYALQCVLIVPLLILCIFRRFCPRIFKKLQNFLFWNGSIRLFIISYPVIVLSSMLNFH